MAESGDCGGSSNAEKSSAKKPEGVLLCRSMATSGESEGSSNAGVGQPPTKPRFEIKRWNAVALYMATSDESEGSNNVGVGRPPKKIRFETRNWNDTCAICRNHIMELCIECQVNMTSSTSAECMAAWGSCKHAFHLHCISGWLKTRKVCPLDNSEWEFAKYEK